MKTTTSDNRGIPSYYGFEIEENSTHDKYNDILHCILVGVLIFSASFSCIFGILSEFDISYNVAALALVLFITSMYLSLIHINKYLYTIGYFSFLIVFTYTLVALRAYANSGYQAFLNIVNEEYSSHFLLSFSREYTEISTNRYITITAMAIYIGMFLVLLINVGIFNDMYFLTTFNLTFWPLQIGIFIGKYPSYVSLVFLFFSYFGVYFLKHSGHFYFVHPATKKKPREYSFKYKIKSGQTVIFHKSNARAMLSLCIFALIVSLSFSIFAILSVNTSENEAILNKSSAKEQVEENVKILTQTGIMGLLNRYDAKGGISGGKLGGVRSITPDYQTDLEVTFVPYTFDTLYLKGYVGQEYTRDHWIAPSDNPAYVVNHDSNTTNSPVEAIRKKRSVIEGSIIAALMKNDILDEKQAKMTIKNIDADTKYLYTPYYTTVLPDNAMITQASTIKGYSGIDTEISYTFVPYDNSLGFLIFDSFDNSAINLEADNASLFKDYKAEAYANYLQIPPSITDELMSYHELIGTSDTVSGQVGLIYNFFLNNYKYDFAPGATPWNKDFVTYFLGKQKRGYCSHFASAATLLLRSYGIPARYIEGYVITASTITETGQTTSLNVSEYFTGTNMLDATSVITAEVSDGNAHAWTEVYIDNFGWVPVDLTVPMTDSDTTSYSDFLMALGQLFGSTDSPDLSEEASEDKDTTKDSLVSALNLGNASVLAVFIIILLLLVASPAIKRMLIYINKYFEQKKCYRTGDYHTVISYAHGRARKHLSKKYGNYSLKYIEDTFTLINKIIDSDSGIAVNDKYETMLKNKINSFCSKNKVTLDELHMLTLKCLYRNKSINKSDVDLLIGFYRML